jgi:hypothetical protein
LSSEDLRKLSAVLSESFAVLSESFAVLSLLEAVLWLPGTGPPTID